MSRLSRGLRRVERKISRETKGFVKTAKDIITGPEIPELEEEPALPTIPKREDPEIEAARKRAKRRAKLRRGRRATILTSGRGLTDQLGSVGRPQARSATLLG